MRSGISTHGHEELFPQLASLRVQMGRVGSTGLVFGMRARRGSLLLCGYACVMMPHPCSATSQETRARLQAEYPELIMPWMFNAPSKNETAFANNPWEFSTNMKEQLIREHSPVFVGDYYVTTDQVAQKKTPSPYRQYIGAFNLDMYQTLAIDELAFLSRLGAFKAHSGPILELGCGTLRLGRLALALLGPRKYHCIEPNVQLVRAAIHYELGLDILLRKEPVFSFNADFEARGSGFSAILAQSIFTHTSADMLVTALKKLMPRLDHSGCLLASLFAEKKNFTINAYTSTGWQWVGTKAGFTWFPLEKLQATVATLGYSMTGILPIPHPNGQRWVGLCRALYTCQQVQAQLQSFG